MRTSLVAAAALALGACGAEKAAAVKTTSSPKPPAWLARAPQSADALYFSGAKEGASSLEEGKGSATASARDQAAQFIGVQISSEHSDVMSTEEAENKASDRIKSEAQATIRSAEVADVYYEKISREAGATTIDRFDVWVLLKLPKAELEKERLAQLEQKKSTAQSSLTRLRSGQDAEKSGESLAALARYRDVAAQLRPLPGNVETGDKQITTSGQLRQIAEEAAARMQAKVRQAVVIGPDWVSGAIGQALSAKGFRLSVKPALDEQAALAAAKNSGAPWVIVIRATTTPGGKVFSQVAASTALDVRALDARSGEVVASSQKQAKGVGRTPEAAQQAAASEAGLGAGNDLAAALLAKENAGL